MKTTTYTPDPVTVSSIVTQPVSTVEAQPNPLYVPPEEFEGPAGLPESPWGGTGICWDLGAGCKREVGEED